MEDGPEIKRKASLISLSALLRAFHQQYSTHSGDDDIGELRASYLSLRIVWGDPDALKEAEIRVYKDRQITFHNFILPVFPFIWRWKPQWLEKLFANALSHPRASEEPAN